MSSTSQRIINSLILGLVSSWVPHLVGAAPIGNITEQLNSVPSIQRQNQTFQAPKGTAVEMMDSIKTTQGKLAIVFDDKTRVQITENSRLVIDDFVYDSSKGSGSLSMKVAMGTVRYASGQIAKNSPQSVSISTPTASISVRGTDFTATVDELGRSTIILLPSCPTNYSDVERDCKTGSIFVDTDEGRVILNQPFQATTVESRGALPSKPVILRLTEDAIGNMLILSPPKELKDTGSTTKTEMKGVLDVDFLREVGLNNALDKQEKEMYQNKLDRNFLDSDFLANILDIIGAQMAAQLNLLNATPGGLLPDYVASSGVIASVDEIKVELCRDNGSDVQCITTSRSASSTVYNIQGTVEIKNRINAGGGSVITLIQR